MQESDRQHRRFTDLQLAQTTKLTMDERAHIFLLAG
jgi:hypothetical protein